MLTDQIDAPLPPPPENLSAGDIALRFERIVPGDPSRDFVPYYHFRICNVDGTDVGHINFRVGDTEHIRLFAGHIGFEVAAQYRGHGFARQACVAIAPLVRTVYAAVTITCDPSNLASKRTIENIGAVLIDEVDAPYIPADGLPRTRRKLRYRWTP